MKVNLNLVHEFSAWQRKELEALFIVLDWTKNYQKKYPNHQVGKEWVNATEITIRIIYDDALDAIKNRGIAFHSGSDITEAPPEVIRCVIKDLAGKNRSSFDDNFEFLNYYYFGRSSSSKINKACSDMVNFMYFGPTCRISESTSENLSTEDIPFGFKFPHSMHFNFEDKRQETSNNSFHSTPSLSYPSASGVAYNEGDKNEMFPPFPAMYFVRPIKDQKAAYQLQESVKTEVSEIYENSQLDLTKYFDPVFESQNSNPAIEFFRISSGFIPPPKNSNITKVQCTSPFCLCSSAYRNEANEDSLEDEEDISEEVPIEPYLQVENISFPKLELPDLLDDTSESYLLSQPFNTPNFTEDLETSNESTFVENAVDTSFFSLAMPRTPKNNPDDKDLMLQPFNTPVTPGNISESSNTDDSLGVDDLGLDEDITKILNRKFTLDNDNEYIRQERLRILSLYEKSRLKEQKKPDENEEDKNFATSTPNWRYYGSMKDKYRSRDY